MGLLALFMNAPGLECTESAQYREGKGGRAGTMEEVLQKWKKGIGSCGQPGLLNLHKELLGLKHCGEQREKCPTPYLRCWGMQCQYGGTHPSRTSNSSWQRYKMLARRRTSKDEAGLVCHISFAAIILGSEIKCMGKASRLVTRRLIFLLSLLSWCCCVQDGSFLKLGGALQMASPSLCIKKTPCLWEAQGLTELQADRWALKIHFIMVGTAFRRFTLKNFFSAPFKLAR